MHLLADSFMLPNWPLRVGNRYIKDGDLLYSKMFLKILQENRAPLEGSYRLLRGIYIDGTSTLYAVSDRLCVCLIVIEI